MKEDKILRCRAGLVRCNRHLQTYIHGTLVAPTDKVSEFSKRAARRKLRHVIRYAELIRYYWSEATDECD